jgi:Sodium:neurotransmitter symporter family.
VLQVSEGIDDLGGMQWELLGCLVLGWILVYIIIWRGLHASGKVREAVCTHTYRNTNRSRSTSNSEPNRIGVTKLRRMRWEGYVASIGEMKNAYKSLVRNT